MCTVWALALKTPPKFPEHTPRQRDHHEKWVGEGKNAKFLGLPPFSFPDSRPPPLGSASKSKRERKRGREGERETEGERGRESER